MPSRDLNDLWPAVRMALHQSVQLYHERWGQDPDVRFICVFRSHEEQHSAYDKYLAGGKHASPPGLSLHEFKPVAAVDFGVFDRSGAYLVGQQDEIHYLHFGECAEEWGLEWGGRWLGRKCDPSHVQAKGYTWEMARDKVEPEVLHV